MAIEGSATAAMVSTSWTAPGSNAVDPVPSPVSPAGTSNSPPADPSGAVGQSLSVTIAPGSLTVAPATESVPLANADVLGRTTPLYEGDSSPMTVVDARGSLVGWHVSVSLQDVPGLPASDLVHAQLCVLPDSPSRISGNPSDIVRGNVRSCAGLGQALPVFWAASGGGGGTYRETAGLTLVLPGSTLPAQVTATLALGVY